MEAPAGRIEQCTNGHLLCAEAGEGDDSSCASRVRKDRGPKCPVCRHGLPENAIRALSAEQSILALPATCRHCSSSMTREVLGMHEAACPRACVACTAEDGGCRWTGVREERDAHEDSCIRGTAGTPSVRTHVHVFTPITSLYQTTTAICVCPWECPAQAELYKTITKYLTKYTLDMR
jgi:hypothetical protein